MACCHYRRVQGSAPAPVLPGRDRSGHPVCTEVGRDTVAGDMVTAYRMINSKEPDMIVVTSEQIANHRIKETKGQVFGVVVRSRGLGGNIMAGLRSLVGGEIHEYTQLLEEARRHAVDRLVENATAMGANGVIMMRFDSAEIAQTMSEIVAYGTAVVVEPA
jgi:uncharacterized protein YbjQ (UPF0145 family)